MTYRARLGKPALVQFNRIPDRALTALREAMGEILQDPYSPLATFGTDVPSERWAEFGDGAGFIQFKIDDAAEIVEITHVTWIG